MLEVKCKVNNFLIILGWRKTMEDSHILRADLTNDVSVFGVFDGHGGREVAYFVEKHFVDELLANPNFKSLKFDVALKETFLRMDELMRTP
jgi:protein phosphatase 1G